MKALTKEMFHKLTSSVRKFLFAINDGMGSGEQAENASELSISLVENFYKAGFEHNHCCLKVLDIKVRQQTLVDFLSLLI